MTRNAGPDGERQVGWELVRESLFHVERLEATTLQAQIREMLVTAVVAGHLPQGTPVPSTRVMAKRLRVSRNTVISAYQALAEDGYLVPRERSGFYVADDVVVCNGIKPASKPPAQEIDWASRLRIRPSLQDNITKPANWQDYPYPFIYGQVDLDHFPITAWRNCMRQAMGRKWIGAWMDDRFTEDDPMLIEQIRQRILTRRGVLAGADEILVTMGAQNALHILANLLIKPKTRFAIENPGYPDMRNLVELLGGSVRSVPVDAEGLVTNDLGNAELVFVTPSHQFPTNVTMSLERRHSLLNWAEKNDALIIEDDYEFETNYAGEPTPALKSLDRTGRVIYVGSFSKSLLPGIRLGFIAGPAPLLAEARAYRRLMLRHPPGNNQRAVALFLALGHHDALIGRLHKVYATRERTMRAALEAHLPGWSRSPGFGGTSFWVEGPKHFDAAELSKCVRAEGVLIEPGQIHFNNRMEGRNTFRLGFSSIPEERIEPGVERMAKVALNMI